MVSQPVKAVILLFPISDAYEQKRREEDERIAGQGQHAIDPTVFWMKQTVSLLCRLSVWQRTECPQISNACGTMALLHALINVRKHT